MTGRRTTEEDLDGLKERLGVANTPGLIGKKRKKRYQKGRSRRSFKKIP